MTRSERTFRFAECGLKKADSVSNCPQLYRMYRKKRINRKPLELPNRMNGREKDWSGREDLNLRPPGPELSQENSKLLNRCRMTSIFGQFACTGCGGMVVSIHSR